MTPTDPDGDFEALLQYLKASRGIDFIGYKRSTLTRRIDKRMQAMGFDNYGLYRDYLEVDPPEVNELFNTILINVTSFFRDQPMWDQLERTIIPTIIEGKKSFEPIRVWSAGCASGEEAYSLAILFAEALGSAEVLARVKIYATDLDGEALAGARQAVYPAKSVKDMPVEYLDKYFLRHGDNYTFSKELRRAVVFGKHDLVYDIPISQIDLLTCRNTLMYFNSETQAKILKRLGFALANDGYLIMGKAEMLLLRDENFEPVDVRHRIFKKCSKTRNRDRLLFLSQNDNLPAVEAPVLENQLRMTEVAFEQDPLAQVLIDVDGILLLANQTARKLFGIVSEDIGKPFKDLEMSYRPVELHTLARQASATQRAIYIKDIALRISQTEMRYLDLHVTSISDTNGAILGVRFIFSDSTRIRNLQDELEQRKQELETAYEELQSSNEELTTTNEELQSTVEELETTNEELQSTNEELETMNEELQSTNEELEHVNREIEVKSREVTHLNAFLRSILGSLQGGIIVVNHEMRVLVWNNKCEEMWGMRADEVLQEHLMGLDIGLPLEKLKPHIRRCFTDNAEQPEIRFSATNRRGKNIEITVVCTPLKEVENGSQPGVLIYIDNSSCPYDNPVSKES